MADDVRDMLRGLGAAERRPADHRGFEDLWCRGRQQRRAVRLVAAVGSVFVAGAALMTLPDLIAAPPRLDVADQPGPSRCEADATVADPTRGPEARAHSENGIEAWALFFRAGPMPPGEPIRVPPEREIKIVLRVTGKAAMSVDAVGTSGQVVKPIWGPSFHTGSNWDRPGDEWGTGWVFPETGCWTLRIRRGTDVAHLQFDVDQ